LFARKMGCFEDQVINIGSCLLSQKNIIMIWVS